MQVCTFDEKGFVKTWRGNRPPPPMVPKALILLHMRDPGNPKKFVALKMCPIASIAVM